MTRDLIKTQVFNIIIYITLMCGAIVGNARNIYDQQQFANSMALQANIAPTMQQQMMIPGMHESLQSNSDGDDSDEQDDDQLRQSLVSNSDPYQSQGMPMSEQYLGLQALAPASAIDKDLRTSASKHHGHHHGAKGWLDMGAWTGKKGSFGWYDKHPVGKG